VVACVIVSGASGHVQKTTRTFSTMTGDLKALAQWLTETGCRQVAMESTGVYWKPVYNLLEGAFEILVVNAAHIKKFGNKTDVTDAEWLADLLRHGLLRGSFIPAKPQRELRELVRHRTNVVGRRAQVVNELQRTLESTNIKLGNVVSDITGVSAMAMLEAILAGQVDTAVLADMARGRLKEKKGMLRSALEGKVEEHHRLILSQLLVDIASYEEQISEAGALIAQRLQGQQELLDRLDEIPGINQRVAQVIAAEVGTEVTRFPTAQHLVSWAGLCPGSNESAGKRRSTHIKPGNRSLRSAVVEAANAAGKKRDCYLSAMYHRIARKRGKKRALIAVGRTILQSCYHMIQRGSKYQDLGADYYERRDPAGLARYFVRRIEKLGFAVALQPLPRAA